MVEPTACQFLFRRAAEEVNKIDWKITGWIANVCNDEWIFTSCTWSNDGPLNSKNIFYLSRLLECKASRLSLLASLLNLMSIQQFFIKLEVHYSALWLMIVRGPCHRCWLLGETWLMIASWLACANVSGF